MIISSHWLGWSQCRMCHVRWALIKPWHDTPVKLGTWHITYVKHIWHVTLCHCNVGSFGSLVFSYVESVGYDEWSKWSNIAMTQAVLASWIKLDHWMRILIQDLGSTFLAYGRHLWHVDPNDPTFRSRTRNIFRDVNVRINVRTYVLTYVRVAPCELFFFFLWITYLLLLLFGVQTPNSVIHDVGSKLDQTWINVDQSDPNDPTFGSIPTISV